MKINTSLGIFFCAVFALGFSLEHAEARIGKKGKKGKVSIELSEGGSSWSSSGDTVRDWKVHVGGRYQSDKYSVKEQIEALEQAIELDGKFLKKGLPIMPALKVEVGQQWGRNQKLSLKEQNEAIEELLSGYQSWKELGIDPFSNPQVRIGNEQMRTEVTLDQRIDALTTQLKINLAYEEFDIKPSKLVEVEVEKPWGGREETDEKVLGAQKIAAMRNQIGYLELIKALDINLEKKVNSDYSKKELKGVLEELLPGVKLTFDGVDEKVKLAKFKIEGAKLGKVLEHLNEGAGVYFHFSKEGITIANE